MAAANGGPKASRRKFAFTTFVDQELGKAIPYGVYDITNNQGWVNVGIDHDTAYFAAASIRRWWDEMGASRFPRARSLLITADGGGSNSSRTRLWKVALQKLADDIGLTLTVCHFPPGTSKWNKIEHRLFSVHHQQLAWQTAGKSSSNRQLDRQHKDNQRFDRQSRIGREQIRNRNRSHQTSKWRLSI